MYVHAFIAYTHARTPRRTNLPAHWAHAPQSSHSHFVTHCFLLDAHHFWQSEIIASTHKVSMNISSRSCCHTWLLQCRFRCRFRFRFQCQFRGSDYDWLWRGSLRAFAKNPAAVSSHQVAAMDSIRVSCNKKHVRIYVHTYKTRDMYTFMQPIDTPPISLTNPHTNLPSTNAP